MTHLETVVIASLVPEAARMNFLPRMFPNCFIAGEGAVYDFMRAFCEAYDGGRWEFYSLSNGGFFMAPATTEALNIKIDTNYTDVTLSPHGAGIVVSLFALCLMAERTGIEQIIENYHNLRDYAIYQHPEKSKISRAID